jgi:hypothetical protein
LTVVIIPEERMLHTQSQGLAVAPVEAVEALEGGVMSELQLDATGVQQRLAVAGEIELRGGMSQRNSNGFCTPA